LFPADNWLVKLLYEGFLRTMTGEDWCYRITMIRNGEH